jgi:hypothetical protein
MKNKKIRGEKSLGVGKIRLGELWSMLEHFGDGN